MSVVSNHQTVARVVPGRHIKGPNRKYFLDRQSLKGCASDSSNYPSRSRGNGSKESRHRQRHLWRAFGERGKDQLLRKRKISQMTR